MSGDQLVVWKGVSPSRFIAGFPTVEVPALLRATEERQRVAAMMRMLQHGGHSRIMYKHSPWSGWYIVAYDHDEQGDKFFRLLTNEGSI